MIRATLNTHIGHTDSFSCPRHCSRVLQPCMPPWLKKEKKQQFLFLFSPNYRLHVELGPPVAAKAFLAKCSSCLLFLSAVGSGLRMFSLQTGGLNATSYSRGRMNIWSPVDGTVWGGSGGMVLLEELSLEVALKVERFCHLQFTPLPARSWRSEPSASLLPPPSLCHHGLQPSGNLTPSQLFLL